MCAAVSVTRHSLITLTCLLLVPANGLFADEWPQTLPGSQPLALEEPLDVVMVGGISRFAERELHAASTIPVGIPTDPDHSRYVADRQVWQTNWRSRLRELIGAVDERVPSMLSITAEPGTILGHSERSATPTAWPVRWDVLEGVTAEGLLLMPAGEATGYAVAIPDASWTPEMFCGLAEGVPAESQFPRRLVESGVMVLVPMLISRDDEYSGHPDIRFTNIPHREFVYRMAFELGRHIIGYEVQKILAAVDVLEQMAEVSETSGDIGLCGVGDGGQLALYAAALGEHSGPTLTGGYFAQRNQVWQEPIDRNIWHQLPGLSDAHIACLAAAQAPLSIEACAAPEFAGPQPDRPGRPDFAAPGTITTPSLSSVKAEFARATSFADAGTVSLFESGDGTGPAGGSRAFSRFLSELTGQTPQDEAAETLHVAAPLDDPQQRERRQLDELVRFTQTLLHRSDKVRANFWKDQNLSSPAAWLTSTLPQRVWVREEMIGELPVPNDSDPHPRTRQVLDEPTHVGYEVVLDVIPQRHPLADELSVIAGGILLLPKDLREGERRPVVVCQHGLEGTPMDTIVTDESSRAWRAYKGFSTQLVQRGFIVYAPQNPYRGGHDFRAIQRKSNPRGRSLFSYIIEQHRVTLRWLATLPWVDAERIGFYGLSYGGKTAVRVPPLLMDRATSRLIAKNEGTVVDGESTSSDPGYCLSICSADFNEWIRKNASSEDRYSYVFTQEYEMFEWNMGHVAGYAELASLMVPRPFMVERGHDDGVAPDEWVAWEFAKVRRLYTKLGLGERTQIEFFDGPHTIHGRGTFEFLHHHLRWPSPTGAVR